MCLHFVVVQRYAHKPRKRSGHVASHYFNMASRAVALLAKRPLALRNITGALESDPTN